MEREQLIETVSQAQKGNVIAKETLYLDAYKSIYRFALRMVKNPEDAEDITQEVFITVNGKIAELREAPAFYKWINQITVNKCNEFLRKYRGIVQLYDEEEFLSIADDDPLNLPDKAIDDEATRKIIMEVIDALPDGQRACVMYYYYSQFTIAQIADMLELNENTVKSRLALARAKIRAALEEKEKKEGIKLYGIPLALTPILRQAMEQMLVPDGVAERMWENISQVTSSTPPTGSSSGGTSGQVGPKSSTGAVSQSATGTGMTLTTKIIIGIIAVAVVTVGVLIIPRFVSRPSDREIPPGVTSEITLPPTQTSMPTNDAMPDAEAPTDIDYLTLYASVLEEYRNYVLHDMENFTDALASPWGEIQSLYPYFGSFLQEDYGYALKDLSGDGIPELILLSRNDIVFALYSLSDNNPILLDSFYARYSCNISADNRLLIYSSNGAADFSYAIWTMKPDGTGFSVIEEIGVESFDRESGMTLNEPRNYHITEQGGKKIISQNEAEEIMGEFPNVFASDANLDFVSLLGNDG